MKIPTSLKFNMEPQNDGLQVRNLLLPGADSQIPCENLGMYAQIIW